MKIIQVSETKLFAGVRRFLIELGRWGYPKTEAEKRWLRRLILILLPTAIILLFLSEVLVRLAQ